MSKEDKAPKVEKKSPPKPETKVIYNNGPVNMPASMIKDEESFKKMWKGKLGGYPLEKAWQEAKEFKAKLK